MDYKKIYDDICNRAKKETKERILKKKEGYYYEGHHIVPKCLGGLGWPSNPNHPNIALLTAREHFLCHWLLFEANPKNYKLAKAFHLMCDVKSYKKSTQYKNRYTPSSRVVEYARRVSKKVHSEYMKNIFWTEDMKMRMSKAHTGKKHSEEVKKIMSEKIKEAITDERRIKMSDRIKGDKNPSKNENVKLLMKKRALDRKRVNCPYCDKEGPINQMKQWHFENCKTKK